MAQRGLQGNDITEYGTDAGQIDLWNFAKMWGQKHKEC